MNDSKPLSLDGGRTELDARTLDRVLAYVDGTLTAAEQERLLTDLNPNERTTLRAMRADAQGLRALRAPHAPEELHEAVMSAVERAELLATQPHELRLAGYAPGRGTARDGLGARPWALRPSVVGAVAAVMLMALGVTWVVSQRRGGLTNSNPEMAVPDLAPVAYAPMDAPFALVLEFDDPDEAQAVLMSAIKSAPEAKLTCCCRGQCTEVADGPPHFEGSGNSSAEIVPIVSVPSHQLVIPASDLSRVISSLVGSASGSVEQRAAAQEQWGKIPAGATVQLPVFTVPATK